jgi:NIPSNAP
MKKHSFRIVDMWESHGDKRLEFVYVLEWADEAARDAAWRAFMSDQEWSAIKRQTSAQHGHLVSAIEDRTLHRTDYYPATRATTP